MTLTLLLAETELEPIPDEVARHPALRRTGKPRDARVARGILDDSLHHEALRAIPEGERRGRPDLAHLFMLIGLDSLLNKRGHLRLLIHTRHDELIRIAPETRIMRNYPRWIALMEQLFHWGRVPREGSALLTLERGWSLARVLAEEAHGVKVLLAEDGKQVRPHAYFGDLARAGDVTCVIGGFPKGGFRADARALVDDVVRLTRTPLTVWEVEGTILHAAEDTLELYRE